MDDPISRQIQRNLAAREQWAPGAAHRRRLTEDVLGDFDPEQRARLCVLGAGNCNDIDLNDLCEVFAEVHLVDVDGDAMAAGVERQAPPDRQRIHLHGGIDLTGVLNELRPGMSDDAVVTLLEDYHPTELPGPFDMVVSTCVLGQLIEAVGEGVNQRESQKLIAAVRLQHIRQMIELTAPGGRGLLVFEFADSHRVPELREMSDEQLPDAAGGWIADCRHHHGSSPAAVAAMFEHDPAIKPYIAEFGLLPFWVWDRGTHREAVAAIQYETRP